MTLSASCAGSTARYMSPPENSAATSVITPPTVTRTHALRRRAPSSVVALSTTAKRTIGVALATTGPLTVSTERNFGARTSTGAVAVPR